MLIIKNKALVLFTAFTILASSFAFAQTANAITVEEVVDLFVSLGIIAPDKVSAARAAIQNATPAPISSQSCVSLSRNLDIGSRDNIPNGEISKLQRFLQRTGDYTYGEFTGYFGPATERAVQKWQARNGILSSGSPEINGYGVIGPRTRSAMTCNSAVSSLSGNSVTLSIDQPQYVQGETMAVKVSGLQTPVGAKRHWVGLYKQSQADDTKYIDWKYLDNSKNAEQHPPLTDGAVTFATNSLDLGAYEVRVFKNGAFEKFLVPAPRFNVVRAPSPIYIPTPPISAIIDASLSTNKLVYEQREDIEVSFQNSQNVTDTDWIGIYHIGDPDSGKYWIDWLYLSGTRIKPTTLAPAGTATFKWVRDNTYGAFGPGRYEVRLYTQGGYQRLTTAQFTIVADSSQRGNAFLITGTSIPPISKLPITVQFETPAKSVGIGVATNKGELGKSPWGGLGFKSFVPNYSNAPYSKHSIDVSVPSGTDKLFVRAWWQVSANEAWAYKDFEITVGSAS
ncbi:MAG: peptidoglycan-binding protein [Candidatus Pacebacteria bacterium]|nr:peptidoglycan-binding protein [Candidatus Paceibacterota bacterium]